jgi:hypothetical protein
MNDNDNSVTTSYIGNQQITTIKLSFKLTDSQKKILGLVIGLSFIITIIYTLINAMISNLTTQVLGYIAISFYLQIIVFMILGGFYTIRNSGALRTKKQFLQFFLTIIGFVLIVYIMFIIANVVITSVSDTNNPVIIIFSILFFVAGLAFVAGLVTYLILRAKGRTGGGTKIVQSINRWTDKEGNYHNVFKNKKDALNYMKIYKSYKLSLVEKPGQYEVILLGVYAKK